MKTKKLKLLTILLFLLPFCVVLLGAGCEKDDPDYDPDSIIGKWELITEDSCIGKNNLITEITTDSVLKTYVNNELISSSSIRIKKGKIDDTIFYDNKEAYLAYAFIKLVSSDTLRIYTNILYFAPVCEYSKRIK